VSHEGSARPSEVLAALFGADVAPRAELARLGLWAREPGSAHDGVVGAPSSVDPLDIESLRRQPAPGAQLDAAAEPDAGSDGEIAPDAATP
jgi:hypothetical protein